MPHRARRTSAVAFRVRKNVRQQHGTHAARAFAVLADSGLSRAEQDDATLAELALATKTALQSREDLLRTAATARQRASAAHERVRRAQRLLESEPHRAGRGELAQRAMEAARLARALDALAAQATAALMRFEISQQVLEDVATAAEQEAAAEHLAAAQAAEQQALAPRCGRRRPRPRSAPATSSPGSPLPLTAEERARQARALARSSYRTQGDASFETPAAHRARQELRGDAQIQQWLEKFYMCFRSPTKSGCVARAEYIAFQLRVVRVLLPEREFSARAAQGLAEADWERDTAGGAGRQQMRKPEFFASLFELVDLWTETIDRDEYVDFLAKLFDRLTVQRSDGLAGWRAGAPPASPLACQHKPPAHRRHGSRHRRESQSRRQEQCSIELPGPQRAPRQPQGRAQRGPPTVHVGKSHAGRDRPGVPGQLCRARPVAVLLTVPAAASSATAAAPGSVPRAAPGAAPSPSAGDAGTAAWTGTGASGAAQDAPTTRLRRRKAPPLVFSSFLPL